MIEALYIATSGLRSEQTQIDVISNNVANINTPGFKKSRVSFADVSYHDAVVNSLKPAESAPNHMVGGGTDIASTHAQFSSGDIRVTSNPLDVAISGDGFLEVTDASGQPLYTRAGQFSVDKDGYLETVDGNRLSANIQIPADATKVNISPTGEVTVDLTGQSQPVSVGNIQLARFMNTEGLKPVGNNNYQATQESGDAIYGQPGDADMGILKQGCLEYSNVDMAEEMTNLVVAQRAYQLDARLVQAADQVLETIDNLRR